MTRPVSGALAAALPAAAAERFVTLASTTSTENSGLFEHLLPRFTEKTGIGVRVVAVGTGQALRLASRGDADLLLVHHRPSEEAFVAAGHGVARHDVMVNDFVLVGPAADPAGLRGAADAAAALARIAATGTAFVSRGDDSGTHQRELVLWARAGVDPADASGAWYRETGSGMGAALNIASAMGAYTLADRATWLRFANKSDLAVVLEGDPALRNEYGVIPVDPARHPHVKADDAQALVAWLLSPEGQDAIAAFRIAGAPAFFPNARAGPARRVVSMNPSLTETLVALGAAPALVGVDDASARRVAEARQLPSVGGLFNPSLEAILALEPDLVVMVPSAEQRGLAERLVELGVPVLALPNITLEELLASIEQLGARVGRGAAAAARVAEIERAFAEIAAASAARPPRKAVLVLQRDPLFVVGSGSWIDALLAAAGAENLGASLADAYPRASEEWLIAAAPELLLDASEDPADPAGYWSRWPSLPAVSRGGVLRVHEDWIRPGPYLDRSLRELAAAVAGAGSAP